MTDTRTNPSLNGHLDAAGNVTKPERPRNPTKPRGKRLAELHAQRLPITTKPLPLFIPHNPLSILHIAWVILSECFTQPPHSSHQRFPCVFSPETRSIHVEDEVAIRALWEKGFFGKGTLSRSEPNWLEMEKKRVGSGGQVTAEEMTKKRRKERIAMKMERARLENLALEEVRKREKGDDVMESEVRLEEDENPNETLLMDGAAPVQTNFAIMDDKESRRQREDTQLPSHQSNLLDNGMTIADASTITPAEEAKQQRDSDSSNLTKIHAEVVNQEFLQLSLEEAFFLSYGLDALEISYPVQIPRPVSSIAVLNLFRHHSAYPPNGPLSNLEPDDAFMLRYVCYHHFRSLGWVVRDGIKFSVDYLLYERGPAFKHAEFAITILSSYTDPYWSSTPALRQKVKKELERRKWHWLHCVNRVQTQVTKTLVLCYVDVPPPEDHDANMSIGKLLKRYSVREFCIRRWSANRNR